MFDINPADAAPIWRQIEEGMRRLIAVGALAPGAPVPSVRDLARELRVNPAPVSRAYQPLTDGGVLSGPRGRGPYAADEPVPMKKSERHELLHDAAARYASTAMSAGDELDEAAAELTAAYHRLDRKST